jgi:hypothetical protein
MPSTMRASGGAGEVIVRAADGSVFEPEFTLAPP